MGCNNSRLQQQREAQRCYRDDLPVLITHHLDPVDLVLCRYRITVPCAGHKVSTYVSKTDKKQQISGSCGAHVSVHKQKLRFLIRIANNRLSLIGKGLFIDRVAVPNPTRIYHSITGVFIEQRDPRSSTSSPPGSSLSAALLMTVIYI